MALTGQYLLVDDAQLKKLGGLENEALLEAVEDLSEERHAVYYSIDKFWDGLHFLLTGVSAGDPLEDDPLSEAIVGGSAFIQDDDSADFITFTHTDELPEILEALKNVDTARLREQFSVPAFLAAGIYPDIWREDEQDELLAYLLQELANLIAFYENAQKKKAHVVVSIY